MPVVIHGNDGTDPLADAVFAEVQAAHGPEAVHTSSDFSHLGDVGAIRAAMARLADGGLLREVGRDLFDTARTSCVPGGPPVVLSEALCGLERRDGIRIVPGGAMAAASLGLTSGVVAKAHYVTDGPNMTIRLGGRTVHLEHVSAALMEIASSECGPVILALLWLGPGPSENDSVAGRLRRILPDSVKSDLGRKLDGVGGWVRQIAMSVLEGPLLPQR